MKVMKLVLFGLPIQNKNSAINALLPFLIDFFKLKEKIHIRQKISSRKIIYMRNQYYYYYFVLPKISIGQACIKNIKLPLPYISYYL